MSTEWNVIVFDKPGSDRTKVRPQHLAAIPAAVNSGKVNFVGPLYHDIEKTKFAGSAYHMLADSKEEIIEFLKQDVFFSEGIWDMESVIANPLGVAYRKEKKL